jgi:hypothetical protein
LELALNASKDRYGDYQFQLTPHDMNRDRQFRQLVSGVDLTVLVSPPKARWEGQVIRVPVPVQKGLASYRLFFLLSDNIDLLQNVKSVEDLRQFRHGQGRYWSSVKILKDNGFQVVTGHSYTGLFSMLQKNRFDLLMRGLNEVEIEQEVFAQEMKTISLDPHVVLYFYLPNYFYVSPKQPRVAQRLEYGLLKLHENGEFDRHFHRYYGSALKKFNMGQRTLLKIPNTNIDNSLFEHDKPYILEFEDFARNTPEPSRTK